MQREEQIKSERTPFGISSLVRELALREIAVNAEQVSIKEGASIQENPGVNYLLKKIIGASPDFLSSGFYEGALWTHLILKMQAYQDSHDPNQTLPKISKEVADVFLQDLLEKVESTNISLKDHYYNLGSQVISEEPELGKALVEMRKYRIRKSDFMGGAAIIYLLFKKVKEGKELEEQLENFGKQ